MLMAVMLSQCFLTILCMYVCMHSMYLCMYVGCVCVSVYVCMSVVCPCVCYVSMDVLKHFGLATKSNCDAVYNYVKRN